MLRAVIRSMLRLWSSSIIYIKPVSSFGSTFIPFVRKSGHLEHLIAQVEIEVAWIATAPYGSTGTRTNTNRSHLVALLFYLNYAGVGSYAIQHNQVPQASTAAFD